MSVPNNVASVATKTTAPPPIAAVAKNSRAERTHDVGQRESRQRDHESVARLVEKHASKRRREVQIQREVIPLDDRRERRDRKRRARYGHVRARGRGAFASSGVDQGFRRQLEGRVNLVN